MEPRKLTRRQFLELSAAMAGFVAVGSRFTPLVTRVASAPVEDLSRAEGVWIPTCCHMCGGTTGILCNVLNGRVVAIKPNPANPIGVSNASADYLAHKGEGAAMCPKGNAGIFTLYDPDRLKKPLKRTNPQKGRGVDPKWKEISWDEALTEIASKLKSLRDAGEAHTLLWFTEDSSFTDIQADLCDLYGTPNYSMHSNLCDVSRKASFKAVLGHDRPLGDTVNARYILFFGWNPLSATKWAHLPRTIMRGIENGAKMVVVDPYLSFTAAKAHEWIPIRPSTDGALALAMANVIIEANLYDQQFIADWVVGFDQFKDYVKDKTPEWAEKITSVPAGTIRRLAREFATTKPAVVDAWSGPGQHSNAVQGGRAIAALAALTGNIDKPGTLLIPNKGGGAHPPIKVKKTAKPRLDGLKDFPMGHASGVYTEIVNRILDGKGPYQPKMAMIIFQNLVLSVPGTNNVIEALKKLEYVVVVDTFLSETAEMADIVLPGTTYLERYEVIGQWVTWPVVTLRQPVVKPIFGQIPEYDVVIELGKRLGLKDAEGKPFFANLRYEDYISKMIQGGSAKITLEQLQALPGAVWMDAKGTQYEKHKTEVKMPEGAVVQAKTGTVKDKDGKFVGVKVGDKVYKGLGTPSGKCELFSESLAAKKDIKGEPVNGLPVYTPRDWLPDDKYPLYLINWKETHHTHSRTFNNPYLMELQSWNRLAINAKTAERLGIKDGDKVWVESPYGKDKAIARVTQGVHPEVVGWQHGFGHWGFGKVARGKGTADGQFNLTKCDPISGMALHKEVCVKVYKA
ncbi:MAG: molybdopterin-dependent oxidoreductase [Chloroflexi bacterium]|nr:molybdopterin-dependent oxidoreductase [Chloroflexota bacterium]